MREQVDKAMEHVRRKEYEAALPFLDEVLAKQPANHQMLYVKAAALSRLGNQAEALELVDQAIELKFNFGAALDLKGNILYKLGETMDAWSCWREAYEYSPKESIQRKLDKVGAGA